MTKIIKGKKTGRYKEENYDSIFGDYDDKDLSKKKMVIPNIIKHDIGYELQFGFRHVSQTREKQFLRSRYKNTTEI